MGKKGRKGQEAVSLRRALVYVCSGARNTGAAGKALLYSTLCSAGLGLVRSNRENITTHTGTRPPSPTRGQTTDSALLRGKLARGYTGRTKCCFASSSFILQLLAGFFVVQHLQGLGHRSVHVRPGEAHKMSLSLCKKHRHVEKEAEQHKTCRTIGTQVPARLRRDATSFVYSSYIS